MRKVYSAEEILEILRSLKTLELDKDGRLDVSFHDVEPAWGMSSINEFVPNSFTRELLELIEYHMSEPSEDEKDNVDDV